MNEQGIKRKRTRIYVFSTVFVMLALIAAIVATQLSLSSTRASSPGYPPGTIIPTPTPPTDNTIGLSATSGTPGTHVFIAGSGFTPGETVQPVWDYGVRNINENSFYLFDPRGVADANGNVHASLFVPPVHTATYTIALKGLKSGVIKTSSFTLLSSLDIGSYVGPVGTVLRLTTWGLGAYESVNVYWNWTSSNPGTLITQAKTNSKGDFSGRTFTIPTGTANGTYTVAAIGQTSQAVAQVQFTVGSVPQGAAPGTSDWSNFGFDQQNTRVNPNETTISQSNVPTLAAKWKTPNPVPYKTVGSPTIANGIVYLATAQGIVTAYDQATGNILWVYYANGPIYDSPTIVNGIAYFASVNYPSEDIIGNYVYALNARSGALIWDNFLPNGGDWVAPLVANGRVFVPEAYKEGISGGFSTFDALTGQVLWSFATPYGIWAEPTLDPSGTNLFVGTGNPCVSAGVPGDGCSGLEEDLNPATGAVIWSYHFPDISGDDDVPAAALCYNGDLYVGLKNGIFYSIDATNGNVLWQYNTGSSGDFGIYSSAAFYNNKVIFGSGDHKVHALNISDGSLAWSFTTGSIVTASPSVANGVVYIGSIDKNFYALNPDTGAQLWKTNLVAAIWSSASISNGVVYAAGGDGTLYAFTPGGV